MFYFILSYIFRLFIGYISSPVSSEPVWHGYLIAVAFFIVSMIQSFFSNHYFAIMWKVGMNIRTSLISAIYRKSLKLDNTAKRDRTTGEIVNLMSVDVQRIALMIPFVNNVWSDPLFIIICLYFLWTELGASMLAGLGMLILMLPINGLVSRFQQKFDKRQMKYKDERIKVLNELLNGIRVIKLYGWEIPFIEKVDTIRDKELNLLKKRAYFNAVSYFLWTSVPFLVSLSTFAVYVLSSSDNVLDAEKAFVSLSLFELLRLPLNMLPEMIAQLVTASVSFKRLNRFLNSTELEDYVIRTDHDSNKNAITIENGTFSWNRQGDNVITLKSINLAVTKGSLVAIVGQVGSGKSSLLSSILGDIDRISGTVIVNESKSGQVAYVPQQAWIRNATLKENILFGNVYNDQLYRDVIEMCALAPDLAILPGGDLTEIGEKGINLSGGQKQRVAIARACYANSNIVLLDDPLSAVDSHVAKHIFTHVLHNETGFLRKRTRVLATNNISILSEVDQIIVLTNGEISEIGSYQELINNSGKFAEFVYEHEQEVKDDQTTVEHTTTTATTIHLQSTTEELLLEKVLFTRSISQQSTTKIRSSTRKRNGTAQSTEHFDIQPINREEFDEETEKKRKLINTEIAETGQVKMSNYITYFRSYSMFWFCIIVFGYILKQCFGMATNIWLAVWSNDKPSGSLDENGTIQITDEDILLRNQRLEVYAALGFAQCNLILSFFTNI